MVDNTIAMKVNNPQMDVRDNEVIRMVAKLIELDGLDA
jgi:ATP-dependent RNA helicase DHX57